MPEVTVTLNETPVSGHAGMTILELAHENGIEIPTLCYLPGLAPIGACRVCLVEVEGTRTLVASCHTPIAQNMVIQTDSPKVIQTRRVIVELLLSNHCGTCYMCDKANICELRKLAADLEIGIPRFQKSMHYYPIEDISPYVHRDLTKCIKCRRCVAVCTNIAGKNILAIAYRGYNSKVVVDCDEPLNKEECHDCYECISVCPTGALSKVGKVEVKKVTKPLVISNKTAIP